MYGYFILLIQQQHLSMLLCEFTITFSLCFILQMYRDTQEQDELAVLEEIQQELVSQGYYHLSELLFVCICLILHIRCLKVTLIVFLFCF